MSATKILILNKESMIDENAQHILSVYTKFGLNLAKQK